MGDCRRPNMVDFSHYILLKFLFFAIAFKFVQKGVVFHLDLQVLKKYKIMQIKPLCGIISIKHALIAIMNINVSKNYILSFEKIENSV